MRNVHIGGVYGLYLSLGSNQGDRRYYIQEAIRMLDEGLKMQHSAISSLLEFSSWGFDGADFLNCVVRYDIPSVGQDLLLHARAVLGLAKEIEHRLGRRQGIAFDSTGKRVYQDRPIDIDILFVGDLRVNEPLLTIPHKLIRERDFVKVPLQEVATPEIRSVFPEIFA